ncbi:MAG: AtpZ/AtpI family protein [Phycisphaerales bacterium]
MPSGPTTRERARQAKAWSIAMDPLYGILGFGAAGYGIDRLRGTFPKWTGILAILGLIAGFWRFIREAKRLNAESSAKWAGKPFRAVEPEESDPDPPEPWPEDDAPGDLDTQAGPKN